MAFSMATRRIASYNQKGYLSRRHLLQKNAKHSMERTFLNRYQAIRLLGEGGMGQVFLARQLDLGRQVVVKVMHDNIAADPKFRDRFERETLTMATFTHPYAVTLYDASLDDPQGPCIVMEYIDGITLDQMVANNKGRLSPGRVGRILGQLCEVLQAAHNKGVIHRDLKPANLMIVEPDTPYEKVKVMDFGLAKLVEGPLRTANSSTPDFAVGTPAYICPEQVRGEPMDHRGDLYSVGIMLYELLTGKLPFNGSVPLDILMAHSSEKPPSFAQVGAAGVVSAAVEAMVMSCLEKDPAKRPSSARDLAELYDKALATKDRTSREQPAPAIAPPTGPGPLDYDQKIVDPHAVVYHMEAWMPEAVAEYKLRGFVQDAGGKVEASVPGLIRVRLGAPGTPYEIRKGLLASLGLRRKAGLIEMYLRLEPADPKRQTLLKITVLMLHIGGPPTDPEEFRYRCSTIYGDLRGYLMGQDLEEMKRH
jgi:serine/threonine-protein kinase